MDSLNGTDNAGLARIRNTSRHALKRKPFTRTRS
jgi:hypothetical protein